MRNIWNIDFKKTKFECHRGSALSFIFKIDTLIKLLENGSSVNAFNYLMLKFTVMKHVSICINIVQEFPYAFVKDSLTMIFCCLFFVAKVHVVRLNLDCLKPNIVFCFARKYLITVFMTKNWNGKYCSSDLKAGAQV